LGHELYPEAENKFFAKPIDIQISFVKDDKGRVTHLVLHAPEQNITAKKIK
jgi:hypothetical protein